MSRIGKRPIPVPAGVTVAIDGSKISVKGPKGELSRVLPADMIISHEGSELLVKRPTDEERHKALHGLTRTLVANMVEGVTTGFKKVLEITGVGYKAEIKPYGALLSLGYSHQIEYKAPEGVKISATKIDAPSTKNRVSGRKLMNLPAIEFQNRKGRKAHRVVRVPLTTGQNIRLPAAAKASILGRPSAIFRSAYSTTTMPPSTRTHRQSPADGCVLSPSPLESPPIASSRVSTV